jgi:malonyl-ACP decarboxylase
MRQGFLHGNLNLEQPIDLNARFCGATSINESVQTAMSNSFGFGGINTSIVLQSVNQSPSIE